MIYTDYGATTDGTPYCEKDLIRDVRRVDAQALEFERKIYYLDFYIRALNKFQLDSESPENTIKPSLTAISAAESLLESVVAKDFQVTSFGPTSDAGVLITIKKLRNIYTFDIYGDGEMIFIEESATNPIAKSIDLETACEFIESA